MAISSLAKPASRFDDELKKFKIQSLTSLLGIGQPQPLQNLPPPAKTRTKQKAQRSKKNQQCAQKPPVQKTTTSKTKTKRPKASLNKTSFSIKLNHGINPTANQNPTPIINDPHAIIIFTIATCHKNDLTFFHLAAINK